MNARTAIAVTGSLLAHAALFGALGLVRGARDVTHSSEPIAVDVIEGRGATASRPAGPPVARSESPQPTPPPKPMRAPHVHAPNLVRPVPSRSVAPAKSAPAQDDLAAPELSPIADSPPASGGLTGIGASLAGTGLGMARSSTPGGEAQIGRDPESGSAPDFRDAIHRRLAEAARACYPAAARRFRLKGSAQVHFCVDGKGGAGAVNLTGTSGSPLLDRAATDCVVPGALPLPGTGCYTLSVDFTEP